MRPAGFSCRRTRPVCTGRTCRLPRSPRARRLHGLPMSPSTSPSGGTQAAPSAQAECFHRPEGRARPGPLRAPNSQSFRPKSALNAVGCLSVRRLLPPPRTSPPDFRRCLPPCRAPTARKGREQGFLSSARQAPAGPATRQTTRQTDGAAGLAPRRISAAGRLLFPCKRKKPGTRHPLRALPPS